MISLDAGSITGNLNFFSIGQNGSDSATLTLKGSTITTVSNNDLNIGDIGASVGVLNVQDNASMTVSSFYIGSANAAGSTATGTVYQTGGTVTQQNTHEPVRSAWAAASRLPRLVGRAFTT
ncbi:MAG: hypothetical protein QM813_11405 [Verrucomicrobiota bacterium]